MSVTSHFQPSDSILRQHQALLAVSEVIAAQRDLASLFRGLAEHLKTIVEFDVVATVLYDPVQNLMRIQMRESALLENVPLPPGIPIEASPSGWVMQAQQSLIIPDTETEERFPELVKLARESGMRSYCFLPLTTAGRQLGALGFGRVKPSAFHEADLEFLQQVANQVAVAVEKAQNFESARQAEKEIRRQLEREHLMLEINNAVVAKLNLPDLLAAIAASLRPVIPHDFTGMALYEAETGQLRVQALDYKRNQEIFGTTDLIPLEGTGAGKAFTSRKTVRLRRRSDATEASVAIVQRVAAAGFKSSCHVPLISGDRALGTLDVMSFREDAFSEDDAELLTQIGQQIAIAVENALNFERASAAEQELARKLNHLRLMLKVTNTVVSQLDLRELLNVISSSINEVMGADTSGIGLYDEERGQLFAYATDLSPGPGFPIPMEGTTGGLAFTSGQPVFVDKPDLVRFHSDFMKQVHAEGYRSGGSIPLIAQGRKLGVLGVASKREYAFSDEDKALLVQVANQVAIAVDNALNFERARKAEQAATRHADRLNLVLRINNAVVSQLDLKELLRVISGTLREMVHNDTTGIALYDPDSDKLRLVMTDFPTQIEMVKESYLVPLEGTMMGLAFTSGEPVFLDEFDLERFPSEFTKRSYEAGLRSCGNIPLIARGRKLGALGVASKRPNAFSAEDIELLTQSAKQIAIAVENALNFERARQAEQEVKRQLDRERLMLEINNAVVSQLGLRELVKTISASLRDTLPHDSAGIALYDPELNLLREYANVAYIDLDAFREGEAIPLEGTPAGQVFSTGQPLLIRQPDLTKYPADRYALRPVEGSPKSACLAPLISHGRNLGVVGVSCTQENRFTDEDLELFNQIAGQIAIAVENALNFARARIAEQEANRQSERVQLLLSINNAVASHLDLRSLMRTISSCLREVLGYDIVGLALYDPEINQLRAYAFDFPDGRSFLEDGQPFPPEGSVSGLAFTSGQPVLIGGFETERFPSSFTAPFRAAGVKSGGAVPVISRGKKLGSLGVANFRPDSFTQEDVELLSQIANQIAVTVENALAFREIETLKNKLSEEKLYLEEEINTAYNFEEVIGSSPALKRILKQVATVAPTDSTVLIQGETGTGKELIARAIHNLSVRRDRTLVKLNCAAIPSGLLESELFGHERGAFTGAIAQRIGRFELAHKGTLFLDEVGEIPLDLQPKLLRVLQEQEFERLGNARTQRVDVRLIAATNRDLASMSAENKYRSDLYYRLNVFPITIPPLRERPEDIPVLVRFFANKFAVRMKKQIKTIPAETVAALQHYSWPGNIRELENMIERAVILTQGAELQIPMPDINLSAKAAVATAEAAPTIEQPSSSSSNTLEAIERDHILRVLNETNWTVGGPNGAAARLGMKRTTLQARMKKLGITRR